MKINILLSGMLWLAVPCLAQKALPISPLAEEPGVIEHASAAESHHATLSGSKDGMINGVSFVEVGTSYNLYSVLLDETNQVAYDPDLNSVAFIHRQNNGTPGGNGGISFDRSLDGGETWEDNFILTPDYNIGLSPGGGNRYPNIAIWNPPGNTDPALARVVGIGPTLSLGGAGWGWLFGVSARLTDGAGVQEDYFLQVPGSPTEYHPFGLTINPNGELWNVSTYFEDDPTENFKFFYINKGVFNTSSNKVDWTFSHTLIEPDYYLNPVDGSNTGGRSYTIAFSPDGQIGYVILLISESSSVYQGIQPIVHKTTDGGANWNRLPDFDFRTLAAFQDYLRPTFSGFAVPDFRSVDAAVDVQGRLHLFSNVRSRKSASNDSVLQILNDPGTAGMYHLTTSTGLDWTAFMVDSITTEATGGFIFPVPIPNRNSISRTQDGEKIFFVWNATDLSFISTNELPNLRIRGFDALSQEYTFTREPTKGSAYDGIIYFPSSAPIVIESGDRQDYEIPIVFTFPGPSDLSPASHIYVRGAGFDDTDFGVVVPMAKPDFSFVVNASLVTFTNMSQDASSFQWDFGDGSGLSTAVNPTKTYTVTGTYNVCLTARNDGTPLTDSTLCKEVNIPILCSSDSAPTNLFHGTLPIRTVLFWTPAPGVVTCQIQGKNLATGNRRSQFAFSSPYKQTSIVHAEVEPGSTWTWRVRCACSFSPLELSPYSEYADTFTVPELRMTGASMAETALTELSLFPNPASNQLTISGAEGLISLEIIDAVGRLRQVIAVQEWGGGQQTIPLNKLEPGFYLLVGRFNKYHDERIETVPFTVE